MFFIASWLRSSSSSSTPPHTRHSHTFLRNLIFFSAAFNSLHTYFINVREYLLYVWTSIQFSRTLVAQVVCLYLLFTVPSQAVLWQHKTDANVNIHIMLWKCTRQISLWMRLVVHIDKVRVCSSRKCARALARLSVHTIICDRDKATCDSCGAMHASCFRCNVLNLKFLFTKSTWAAKKCWSVKLKCIVCVFVASMYLAVLNLCMF